MKTGRKILIGIGIVAALGVLAFLALRQEGGNAVEVKTEIVHRRNLVSRVSATGHIEPKTSVDITTEVAGRIVELPVEEGQDVEAGQLLLAIDPTQFQAAVERARATLSQFEAQEAQARAAYRQSSRDARRLEQLKERTPDLVTDTEVEQAVTKADVDEALWKAAQHAVDQARASLEQAEDQLAKTTIHAPMSGRVTRLNVERGETAIVGTMNNPGSLLLTVADLSVMEAVIEVDETDIPDIQVGDSTSVEIDAFPNRRFSGRVTKIGNSSIRPRNPAAGTGTDQAIDFEVRITLDDPPDGVRPDLSATADVITDTRNDVLAIPITALTLLPADEIEKLPNENLPDSGSSVEEQGDVEGVFVVDGDIVRFRPVEVGITGESYFEVTGGLEEGEQVVSGSFQAIRELKDGSRIKILSTDTTAVKAAGPAAKTDDGGGAESRPGDSTSEPADPVDGNPHSSG
ncbi:MAG: efflux RND transporter periplasmic adaptor subunit [Gemmatimonadota bacterium]